MYYESGSVGCTVFAPLTVVREAFQSVSQPAILPVG